MQLAGHENARPFYCPQYKERDKYGKKSFRSRLLNPSFMVGFYFIGNDGT
jgi:hypothetical protein